MVNSHSRIALGRYDPWRRTPSLEIQDGTLEFLPGRGAQDQFQVTSAAFPPGSYVEYQIQKGDMYFEGDRSQTLRKTLSVVAPDGSRKQLASGSVLYVSLSVASRNLEKLGIPFRVVSVYEEPHGEKVETAIPTWHLRDRFPVGLLLGTSNLWLGTIAGFFIHRVAYLIALGTAALMVLTIAAVRSSASKRAALVKLVSVLPIYAGGYAFAVVLARFSAQR
jgi:hypothetical protein